MPHAKMALNKHQSYQENNTAKETTTKTTTTTASQMRSRTRRRRSWCSLPSLTAKCLLFASLLCIVTPLASGSTLRNVDSNIITDASSRLNATTRHRRQSSAGDLTDGTHAPQDQSFAHYAEEPMALAGDQDQESQQQPQQHQAQSALSSRSSSSQAAGKRTLYACEKEQLEIECQLGEAIQMVRANYGRFSIQICNDHGQLDWKVNCMSSQSYDIIARSCQNKQSCQLLASNDVFGDACPGTQKYLEVHYLCVPANRTTQPSRANTNVIQLETTTQVSNSESGTSPQQPFVMRPPHWTRPIVSPYPQQQQHQSPSTSPATAQLPHWIHPGLITGSGTTPVTIVGPSEATTGAGTRLLGTADTTTTAGHKSHTSGMTSGGVQYCPEIVMRGTRWPTTEAGLTAQMPCPAHSTPSVVPYATTLVCQQNGQWADRMQAGRCQSSWLRNLTQRLEAGDSPLSILSDLVQYTQPAVGSSGGYWTPSGVLASSTGLASTNLQQHTTPLFGDDLVQIGRVVGRLVEEMGDQLARISDDKQRISFARSMIQLFVDLVSNLAGEQQQPQSGAWADLTAITGERQRVAGQLVSGLESACVLLAGALQQTSGSAVDSNGNNLNGAEDFHKITDFVYVAIQTFSLDSKQRQQLANGSPASYLQKFQVTFPSQSSLLGTRWMNSDQRFTLNLQASNSLEVDQQTGQPSLGQQQQLKIVSVMLRGLGAQMDPIAAQQRQQQQQQSSDKSSSAGDVTSAGQLVVNSDLVSFSIVADSMRSSIKVDLSAPIELVFKHNNDQQQQQQGSGFLNTRQDTTPTMPSSGGGRQGAAYCVYWDATTSDWLTDGCKLVETNRTHSVCACNHLTTFALLNELDQTTLAGAATASGVNDQARHRPPRVNLDSVEQELILAAQAASMYDGQPLGATIRTIYMAKLLEGNLFTYQQGTRTFLYVSCCLSALLLALLLAAAAYNRAHARRLLGSMPAEPPPSLLVANYHNSNTVQQPLSGGRQAPLIETSTTTATSNTTRTSPPTSYSSNGVSDLIVKQDGGTILGQEDEMNGFYSLIGNGGNQYAPAGQQHSLAHAASYHHLASGNGSHTHSRKSTNLSHLALVPIHLIVHLLLLQFLLILLIESQNFLQWNAHQAKQRAAYLPSDPLMGGFSASEQQQAFGGGNDLVSTLLNPIGTITWLVVLALYYLVSTLAFWLLAKLIQLNGHLATLNGKLAGTKNVGLPPKNHFNQQSIQMISGSIYQQQQAQQQMPQANRYGQCQIHNQQSSNSPTLSAFSSSLAQDLNPQQHRYTAGGQPQLSKLQKDPIYGRQLHATQPATTNHVHCLVRLLSSTKLAGCLTHFGPLLMSGLLVWLTYERVQPINLFAFTTSMSSQLAYWPLAVNASWTFPLAALLYCLPSVCLALGVLALVSLRRHFRQIYGVGAGSGGQATTAATSLIDGSQQHLSVTNKHHHLESAADLASSKKRQAMNPSAQLAVELAMESKCAKFVCLTLLALLSLNSICWISFFIHCHQAISQTGASGPSGNHLILAFASSNLLISLLICCSQRQQLRRACHLLGLSRLALALSKACCQLGDSTKCSPASSLSASSSYYGGGGGGGQHHAHQEAGGHQQHPAQHYGTGEHLGQQQQQTYGGQGGAMSYGQAYPPMHQHQHLYQQLADGGHIYDSATNLNSGASGPEQDQSLSAFHLMAQQQQRGPFNNPLQHHHQQQQQQQPMINYTLGRASYNVANVTGPHFHLDHHPHPQQQQFNVPASSSMTLKLNMQSGPMSQQQQQQVVPFSPAHHQHQQQQQQAARKANGGGGNNPHDLLMCPISAGQPTNGKKQLSTPSSASSSGEADGPLVALARTTTTTTQQQSIASNNNNNNKQHQFSIATNQSTPATFGPNQISGNNSNHQQQQQHNHFQLATTEHRQSDASGREFALNAGHGGNQDSDSQSSSPGQLPIKHCNYGSSMASSGVAGPGQQNYTEALRAAMAQEANQQQQHFRRTNSAAMRQQQQQQQHRSFASSASAASSGGGGAGSMMIDAHQQQNVRTSNLGDILASGTHAPSRSFSSANNGDRSNNIYDVANCGGLTNQ